LDGRLGGSTRSGALLVDLGEQLSELLVAEMHLSTEMVGQTSVRVEDREVGSADLAHPELLVTRRSRRLGQVLELFLELRKSGEEVSFGDARDGDRDRYRPLSRSSPA
jgi:hypothetical protein